jgi:diguanylate cyclase (GGDEF)-like protein
MADPRPATVARRASRLVRGCVALAAFVFASALHAAEFDAQWAALEQAGRAQPQAAAAQLDTLLARADTASSARLEGLALQGLLYAQASDASGVERVAVQLEERGRALNEPLALAAANLARAELTNVAGNLARADRLVAEAMARLPADAPPHMRLRFLAVQGAVKDRSGKLEDAVRVWQEALVIADRLALGWRQAELRSALAYSYFQAGQLDAARRLNDEALALAALADDNMAQAGAWNTQGILLDALGDAEGERRSFQSAIEHARRANAKERESLYMANLADFFLKRGEYATALQLSQQALPLVRELNSLSGQTVALANMGLAYISLRQFDTGRRYLAEAIAIDERRGSSTGVAQTLEEMGKYLEKAGDARGALDAYQRFRRLSDEINQRDQQKAIVEMQERFDNERRTRELELLHRDNQLKTEQLHRRELLQRAWVLLAAIGLLSAALIALLARRVRGANRALATSNEQLKVVSECDPLTGLANRRHFHGLLRGHDERFAGSVFLIDIDHFKRINDAHGHAVGDAVLVEVAERLSRMLRAPDLLVRWGGEEFLVVVRSLAAQQVEALAQRLLDAIAGAPVVCDECAVPVSASIGFATFPIEPHALEVSWDAAIDLVDTAMYLAKAHGRNRAYGLRLLLAEREDALPAITRALEDAWRDGRVALTLLQGPGTAEPPAAGARQEAAA